MTRRIALAILVTVWAMLIAGGVGAYLTTRAVLLADLDESLKIRALSLIGGDMSAPGQDERFLVRNEAGQTLPRPTTNALQADVSVGTGAFATLADGQRVRSLTLKIPPHGTTGGSVVIYSRNADQFDRLLERLALSLAVLCLLGGLVAASLAIRVSRVALTPLRITADVIGSIDERQLNRRIHTDELPPELAPMAARLNEMLARLEQAFTQRRQFMGDASHELRTPVAAMLTSLEVALRRPRDAEDYRRIIQDCLGDAKTLKRLVERLMEQVRSERLTHDEAPMTIDLGILLEECAQTAGALPKASKITIVRSFEPGVKLSTQVERLRSVVSNLLSNAVEYNHPGGRIDLSSQRNGAGVYVTVRDTGSGIAPAHLPNLFQPFYRADRARQLNSDHLGLGLALVKAHLDAMGGTCEVQSQLGSGSLFKVWLPDNVDTQTPVGAAS